MNDREINQPLKGEARFFYGYIIVAAAFIIQVVMFGSRMSFGVFFKPIISEFGWTRALISGAFSVSTIVQGLSGILMGSLNDKLGPRVVMTLCGFLIGIGFVLMSQINAAWQLYFFYVVIVGIGMGGLLSPPMSTVARWFVARRSVMAGIVIAGGGIGGIIVPPLATWLISTYDWRNTYIVIGAPVLVIVVLSAQFLKRDPSKMGMVPDGSNKGQKQELNLVNEGLSFKEAIYTWQLWMTVALLFFFGFSVGTILTHIVPHATDLGISDATAANILATIGASVLIGCIVLGRFADRMGNRKAYIICFILISAALFWLLRAREVWMLYLFSVVLGFGAGGATALMSPLVAELFGIKSHGLIFGVCAFCQIFGSAVGPFISGYMFDVSGSYQRAFLVCVAVGVFGLILSAILRPIKVVRD